ncbi:MAG TPA: hypothetical protein VD815_11385 [Candidatus Saccharimonadales bacterium]|nr:hypothetical protein [Candidatus Saccharimonadales bacterium]
MSKNSEANDKTMLLKDKTVIKNKPTNNGWYLISIVLKISRHYFYFLY